MIDKFDKAETSGNDRQIFHLDDERWIIISREIDAENIICIKLVCQKKKTKKKTEKKQLI
jgi:hypothetical protein